MKKSMLKVITVFMLLAYSFIFAQLPNLVNNPDRILPQGLRYLYVAPTGSDENSGAMDKPFLTINKAAEVAIAGDVVVIKSGTYMPNSKITPVNSGTATNPIIYFSEIKNEAIIDGSNSTNGTLSDRRGLFDINGKKWIVIDGLKVINAKMWGLFASGGSDNIIFKNCKTYNTGGSGICAAGCSNIIVLNNNVQKACQAPGGSTINTSECITMASVNTFEVAYNTVFDRMTDVNNGGEGIDAKNACSNGTIHHNTVFDLVRVGIYVDAFQKNINNIAVYANKVYNCTSGISLASEEGGVLSEVKVHDNLVYNIGKVGIRIAGYLNNGPVQNIYIYQNTIYNCGFNGNWENCGLLVEASNAANFGFYIRNNMISGCPLQIKSNSNQSFPVTIDNNLFFGAIGSFSPQTSMTNRINLDPMFENTATFDFRLKAGSPAIDKATGTPISTKDLLNFTRDPTPDLGAFEFNYSIWTGTTSTAFETAGNWRSGIVPTTTNFIYIPTGLTNYPVISSTTNTTIAGGVIKSGAAITVNEGKILTNTGILNNEGNLILKSNVAGTAILVSNSTINNVTLQRYLTSKQRGWRLLSNPLASTTFSALATASNLTLGTDYTGEYLTAPGLGSWTNTNGTGALENNKAYKVFITGRAGEAPTYANGPTNVTLVINGAAANAPPSPILTSANQYYLVANPYTAPLSVRSILAASTNLSNTVSYYNPTNLSNGTTDLILKKGGYDYRIITAGDAGDANDVVIHPMGALFVKATSSGAINVPKSTIFIGTNNSGTATHKTAQTKVDLTNDLKVEVSSGDTYYDTVTVRFKAAGNVGSNIDFEKLANTIFDFYSLAGIQKMAVSELELMERTIPLGITTTELKSFTFKVTKNTIPEGFEAVLVDNLLNTNTVLTPGTIYNFAIDSTPASQGDARFAIDLKKAGSLGVNTNELDAKIQVYPNPSRGQFNISNSSEAVTIEISTLNGQVIHTQTLNSGTSMIQTKAWAKGVYILKATNNIVQTTKKLILQ